MIKNLLNNYYFWIALVVIVFLIIFYKPISEKVKKIKNIGKAGVAFEEQQDTASDQSKAAEQLLSKLDNQYILDQEAGIRKEFGAKLGGNPKEMEKVLIRYLAVMYMVAEFEKIYRIIYGSQIKILLKLNNGIQTEAQQLLPYYQEAANEYPSIYQDYAFPDYMGYLTNESLVVLENNATYGITLKGRTFLSWLINIGYSFEKAF